MLVHPGVALAVDGEHRLEQLRERLGPRDLVERGHPLVVVHALGLHRGHRIALGLEQLGAEDLAGVVEHGFDHRHDVERERVGVGVEEVQRGKSERCQRLVEGEGLLEVDGDPDRTTEVVGFVQLLHHVGVEERGEEVLGAGDVLGLPGVGLVVLGEQSVECSPPVAGSVEHVEQHRVAHRERGRQRLRRGAHQAIEGRLAPRHHPRRRLLLLDLADLLVLRGPSRRLRRSPVVLDDVVRGEGDDGAHRVEARPPGAAADLVELPRGEEAGRRSVVLGQGGEDHGADGHVDADAEGVGPADDLQQSGLGQLLHQTSVLGQHPRVVHADAVAYELGERPAEPRREAEPADELGDLVLLGAGEQVDAHQRLRPLDRRCLGEVNDVHGGLVRGQQLVEHLGERRHPELVDEGDGTGGRPDDRNGPVGAIGERVGEPAHIAERGGHQDELSVGELE